MRTPNLDRLASEGARFEQYHAQNTVCGPSRCEGGCNRNQPQDFEPMEDFAEPFDIYYPKIKLQNERLSSLVRNVLFLTSLEVSSFLCRRSRPFLFQP